MKTLFLPFLVLCILHPFSVSLAAEWEELLDKPVDDEWQQILGVGLKQFQRRKAESLADKIEAIVELIQDDHGRKIPVTFPDSFREVMLDPIPATREMRIGLEMTDVPAKEVFQYLASMHDLKLSFTKEGVSFRRKLLKGAEVSERG